MLFCGFFSVVPGKPWAPGLGAHTDGGGGATATTA